MTFFQTVIENKRVSTAIKETGEPNEENRLYGDSHFLGCANRFE